MAVDRDKATRSKSRAGWRWLKQDDFPPFIDRIERMEMALNEMGHQIETPASLDASLLLMQHLLSFRAQLDQEEDALDKLLIETRARAAIFPMACDVVRRHVRLRDSLQAMFSGLATHPALYSGKPAQ